MSCEKGSPINGKEKKHEAEIIGGNFGQRERLSKGEVEMVTFVFSFPLISQNLAQRWR
jgi:hypothetical protein